MKEKKTFKQRCEEAKIWFDNHKTQIGAGIILFGTGALCGIIRGAKIQRDYLDDTISVSLQNGYERGTRDTRNRIGNEVVDNGSYELVNRNGDVLTLTGTISHPEEEHQEE